MLTNTAPLLLDQKMLEVHLLPQKLILALHTCRYCYWIPISIVTYKVSSVPPAIFARVTALSASLPVVTFKSVILIVVTAFVAKSSATIVPSTIFADVTVLSPGVRPSG